MAKKTKNKNRKIDFTIIFLLIINIVLILWLISLNQDTHNAIAIKDYTRLLKDRMIITNEKMGDDHLYSFELQNTYDITKECLINATITIGSEMVSFKNQYVGKIKPGKSAQVSIYLGELPQGRCRIRAVPQCESVS